MVARTCVAKRAEYTGQFSTWTTTQLNELDAPFTTLYKKLTKNTHSYPTELLYLPTSMGGLGLHRTSDGIQTAKFSILQRHMMAGGPTTTNIETLLCNSLKQSHQSPLHTQSTTIIPPPIKQHLMLGRQPHPLR